jgi:uncharacterized protein (TIGR02145 family)
MRTVILSAIMGLGILLGACEKNHLPVIINVSYSPEKYSAGTIYTFTAETFDEDGDSLLYEWTSDGGEFISETNLSEVSWRSPVTGSGQDYKITLKVSDGEFSVVFGLSISLTDPVFGKVEGYVYFAKCKVPVQGVAVKAGEREAVTDKDGYYIIEDALSGEDTIKATKEDFSPVIKSINIPEKSVLHLDMEMISVVHSTKVSGTITDQEGDPLEYVEVVVLNPNGSESLLQSISDENGVYRIQYIPHGQRKVIIRREKNEQFKFREINETIEFSEIEERHDFIIEKISLRGHFTDPRDGTDYPYITIGEDTWMTVNLAYLPRVNPPTDISVEKPYFYVYGYEGRDTAEAKDLEMYRNFGVLYNWEAAQRICPPGWHLPGINEWWDLIFSQYPQPGDKLRSISGWEDNHNGTNTSGFSAVPAGKVGKDGTFSGKYQAAYFQTSSETSTNNAYSLVLSTYTSYVRPNQEYKSEGYSVRCVRDK